MGDALLGSKCYSKWWPLHSVRLCGLHKLKQEQELKPDNEVQIVPHLTCEETSLC